MASTKRKFTLVGIVALISAAAVSVLLKGMPRAFSVVATR